MSTFQVDSHIALRTGLCFPLSEFGEGDEGGEVWHSTPMHFCERHLTYHRYIYRSEPLGSHDRTFTPNSLPPSVL
jgi:hypothetical protein